jgi:hypothetical protein
MFIKPPNLLRKISWNLRKPIAGLFLPFFMMLSMPLSAEIPLASQASAGNGKALVFLDDQAERSVTRERKLAEFRYNTGTRVVFTYDETSQEYGLLQEGVIGESEPLVVGPVESLLEVFLEIAPQNAAVPEKLLSEPLSGMDLSSELNFRKISKSPVTASQLTLPITTTVAAAGQGCFSSYYSWSDWHDNATSGLAPKTYYASSFGGKKRYADSYVLNCTPEGSPSYLWARHRIYYKKANGKYKKHFDGKVAPWHWQSKHKGSIKRWRKIIYDDNWNSSPSCGSCEYTREGRFHN